jgi:EAL domain-containing protein (putative c-di-GMP-specific phosphodiesterase class I)/GGDEF domain-containing protein
MNFWSRGEATHARRATGAPIEMPRVPAPTSPATAAHRVDIEALLPHLQRMVSASAGDAAGAFAVFFISLRRSDRTQALAGVARGRAATQSVADLLAAMLRPQDRYAFCSFDDILLVVPDVDSQGRAILVASRIAQTLQEPLLAGSGTTRMRPAVGCALFPAHGNDVEALIAVADRASQAARTSDEGYRMGERAEHGAADTALLTTDLANALQANQLEVWLQPQLDLKTGRFNAAEALIRWPRAEGLPRVSPIATVELAEANGLMPDLTLFVLNTVLRQSAEFARRDLDLRIAINVSASMLTDSNLPMTVRHALELWDVAPDRLTLEVTENTLMQDVERSLAILHELKALGTHLSLDDFGTGYSSFAYLRRMPLDELKIDQLFVRNLSKLSDGSANPQREGDLRIVRSIIDIAHNFDLHTVAEGVEDAATLELLRGLGCDVIQGYHTGRPMPIPAAESWWRERDGIYLTPSSVTM